MVPTQIDSLLDGEWVDLKDRLFRVIVKTHDNGTVSIKNYDFDSYNPGPEVEHGSDSD